jgi:hypothetical protein
VKGLQSSGIVNIAGKIDGLQAAGILNINGGGKGVMMGLVNISTSEDIIPIGLVNIVKNGILHPAIYVDDMLFTNLSFRSGNKYFYAVFSAGFNPSLDGIDIESQHLITRGGIGFELPIRKAFIDLDLTTGNFYSFDVYRNINVYQARLTGGFKFMKHLGVFAGVSFDFIQKFDNNPYPEELEKSLLKNSYMTGSIDGGLYRTGFFAGVQF